jgi:hypothetical protein
MSYYYISLEICVTCLFYPSSSQVILETRYSTKYITCFVSASVVTDFFLQSYYLGKTLLCFSAEIFNFVGYLTSYNTKAISVARFHFSESLFDLLPMIFK